MSGLYRNILETIGRTPIVRLNKLAPPGIDLYVKLEAFNPLGSVKDRLALGIIEAAEKDGTLQPGQTVVEATSGNTGIGLAMVCAQKGYPLVVTMAENYSVERRRLMRFLGAQRVACDTALKLAFTDIVGDYISCLVDPEIRHEHLAFFNLENHWHLCARLSIGYQSRI